MATHTHHCVFCDKSKEKHEIIEGINGDICTDCLAVIQSIHPTKSNESIKQEKKEKNTMSTLKERVDEFVMGQEDAKKQLIVELYKHYKTKDMQANNIFLVGDSGVGKTYLMRTLASILKVPFLEVDITGYSETGYKGKDITDFLDELILQYKGNKEKIESAIVFLDEIDKMTTTTSGGEHSTKVQHALLKVVEGMEYHYNIPDGARMHTGTIDTSKILFVAAGACVGLEDIRNERISPSAAIGFKQPSNDLKENLQEIDEYIGTDLIEFGFIPEFVGRFPLVLELHPLSKENIKDILTIHPDNVITKTKELFYREGIDLIITDEDIDWLAEEAIKHPLGVRSISHVLTKKMNHWLFDTVSSGTKTLTLKEVIQRPDGHNQKTSQASELYLN